MIYVTNLPYHATEEKMMQIFSPCGKIVDILFQPNMTTANIESYVEFTSASEVRNALCKNEEVEMDGNVLSIRRCRPIYNIWDHKMNVEPNKIYVSNLPTQVMKKNLRNPFHRVCTRFIIILKNFRLILIFVIAF